MRKICVYCGSSSGNRPVYRDAARQLAETLVRQQMVLVYGGANLGLMGELANRALDLGGEVIGVMPKFLAEKEIAHTGLSDLRIVGSMHERKLLMAELADGFIALPGGLGTLEEIFEVLTWGQLGLHPKPCGFLNALNYYDHLVSFLDHAVEEKFLRPENRSAIFVETSPERMLQRFKNYRPSTVQKWIGREQT